MKLRNKKTGEIVEVLKDSIVVEVLRDREIITKHYTSLTELNEEWEDYKPVEPLIEDEKISKAVRAWAEALELNRIRFDRLSQGFSFSDGNRFSAINFDDFVFDLLDGKEYTIAELCGKEEE